MKRWLQDTRGATSIEYALIALGIFLAIVASVQLIGPALNTTFASVNTGLAR
jgi:pilus assembly protein Flp/PilA